MNAPETELQGRTPQGPLCLCGMLNPMAKRCFVVLVVLLISTAAWAQAVEYTLSFPAPQHRWMQVEVRFTNVPQGALQVRMARTSPGRYALHEFAKNVFDVSAVNGKGQPLAAARPDPHQWDYAGHDGTVIVTYKIFGDRTDESLWTTGKDRRQPCERCRDLSGAVDDLEAPWPFDQQDAAIGDELDRVAVGDTCGNRLDGVGHAHRHARRVRLPCPLRNRRVAVGRGTAVSGRVPLTRGRPRNHTCRRAAT